VSPACGTGNARSTALCWLAADDVRQALAAMAARYSAAAVSMGHLALKRAIRHAEANDLVSRNVATLADTPKGQEGRPSKSLTPDQATAVIIAFRCERPGNVKALAGQRPWAGQCWPRGTAPWHPQQSSRGDVEVVRLEAVRGHQKVERGHVGHRDRDQGRERVHQPE